MSALEYATEIYCLLASMFSARLSRAEAFSRACSVFCTSASVSRIDCHEKVHEQDVQSTSFKEEVNN